MYYYSIKSGSNGNCSLYNINNIFLLMDIGVSIKYLKNALNNIGLTIFNINYIFLTHEHIDHIKGINTFIKYYKIPIYCSLSTANVIINLYPNLKNLINILNFNNIYYINDISIKILKTPHDSLENIGYIFKYKNYKLAHFTDLGFIPKKIINEILNCHTIVLEANYETDMLLYSQYPYNLKTRIASVNGHLSNKQAFELSYELIKKDTKNIILSHLSERNNSIDIIKNKIIDKLNKQFDNKRFNITIAPINYMEDVLKII